MSDSRSDIPQPELRIIVVGPSKSTNEIASILKGFNAVSFVQVADTLPDGMESLRADDINTIFIDPLEFDLEQACSFIFRIRRVIPQIVFVICSKRSLVETNRAIFFQGERSRLSHYFFLDKETPTGWIDAEIESIIGRCIYAHRWIRTLNDVDTLRDGLLEGDALSPETSEYVRLIDDARGQLMALLPYKGHPKRAVTGEQTSGYIGRSVIERIRQSRYFLSLITRVGEKTDGTFTCSPWLLEEKGVALAFDKRIVMLVEDGVTDYGLMQGDWERIHFDTKSFSVAAIRAINQIKSYRGDG